jgi:hypothetical protein
MGRQRSRFSADFKARVALEAIREQHAINELASEYGVHPNLIQKWKRHLLSELPQVFNSRKALERSLAIGAFNQLDIQALVDHLCAHCVAGVLDDERTQLLLRDQEEETFHVINTDEEMRTRGMRMPWWGPEEANDL